MDRGAWRATVHGMVKSRTQLKRQDAHTYQLKQATEESIQEEEGV